VAMIIDDVLVGPNAHYVCSLMNERATVVKGPPRSRETKVRFLRRIKTKDI